MKTTVLDPEKNVFLDSPLKVYIRPLQDVDGRPGSFQIEVLVPFIYLVLEVLVLWSPLGIYKYHGGANFSSILLQILLQNIKNQKIVKNIEGIEINIQMHQKKVFGLFYFLKNFDGRWITTKSGYNIEGFS